MRCRSSRLKAGILVVSSAVCAGAASLSWAAVTTTGDATVPQSGFNGTVVGNTGTGTLTVDGGSALTSFGTSVGYAATGNGAVTITGTGTKWTSGGLNVGWSGVGQVTLSAGAQVSSSNITLGVDPAAGGTINIDGAGSIWTNGGDIRVGNDGSGMLSITGGAQLKSSGSYYATIGHFAGATGSALVSGPGSSWNYYSLSVGYEGSGSLTVNDGGAVTVTKFMASLADLHGNGTINASGGAVLDTDLRFDATHGTTQALAFGTGGTLNVTFNAGGDAGAGYKATGSMLVADGRVLNSMWGYIGLFAGSNGAVMVSGAGSKWTQTNDLIIGNRGNASLRIESGGAVVSQQSGYSSYIAKYAGSTASVVVTGVGSTWTNNGSFLSVGSAGTGSLTVSSGGQVSSKSASVGGVDGNGSVTVTGAGSKWTATDLTVASQGTGSLSILAGGQLNSAGALLGTGFLNAATGVAVVTVNGAGSLWTDTGELDVGARAKGTLAVTAGGQVNGYRGVIGSEAGSTGFATISGPGSKWASNDFLKVGASGTGTLTIADSGQVSAATLNVTAASNVRLNVSGDNMLVLGKATAAGSVTNNGNVSFYADAFLPAGTYHPIADSAGRTMTWSGTGAYKATGGAWNNTDKTFVVPAAVARSAGAAETLTSGERLIITDAATGRHLGASFGTISGSVSFAADPMSPTSLSQLAPLLAPGQQVLDGWDFTTNFTGGGEVLLSYDVGQGFSDVAVWHVQNGVWSTYTPTLLSYESDGIVSFTVSSFSGYAVTGSIVPEPAGFGMLLPFLSATVLRRRRRHAHYGQSPQGVVLRLCCIVPRVSVTEYP